MGLFNKKQKISAEVTEDIMKQDLSIRAQGKEIYNYLKDQYVNEEVIEKQKQDKVFIERQEMLAKLKYTLLAIIEENLVEYTEVKIAIAEKYKDYIKELIADEELQVLFDITPENDGIIFAFKTIKV